MTVSPTAADRAKTLQEQMTISVSRFLNKSHEAINMEDQTPGNQKEDNLIQD